MNEEHAELYARIQAFDIDGGDAAFPFAARLAKENGWSAAYAARAIREYRQFAFLAVAAGHPVTPSEAVDQVWHLHLTYTRSYWGVFCQEVLGTPLHHQPTRGGQAEHAKFTGWYHATLESYRRLFGHAPPRDLWPDPQDRWRHAAHLQWVDLARRWTIPKPRRTDLALAGIALTGLALLLAGMGCVGPQGGVAPPFDPRGPTFMKFYFIALAVAFAAAGLIRWRARGPGEEAVRPPNLDVYSIAYLNGGATLAADTAIASLVDANILGLDPSDRTLWRRQLARLDAPPREQTAYRDLREGWVDKVHPLERAACNAVHAKSPQSASLSDVRKSVVAETDDIREQLAGAGLIVAKEQLAWTKRVPTLVALSVPMLGMINFGVGLHRDKPVGLLVFACIASAIAAWMLFMRAPHRTRRGDAVLDGLRTEHRDLQATSVQPQGAGLSLGMAIFGLGILQDGPLGSLRQAFGASTPTGDNSGAGGGCGCGGDGSCGGGGCGGCGGD